MSMYKKIRIRVHRLPEYTQYLVVGLAVVVTIGGLTLVHTLNNPKDSVPSPQSTPVNIQSDKSSAQSTEQPAAATTPQPDSSNTQCSQVDIPYGRVELPAIWLYKGQSEVSLRGVTGKKQVCTDSYGKKTETVVSPAYDETIRVGTKDYPLAEPEPEPEPQYTYEQALSLATKTCTAKGYIPDSTDMTYCKISEMVKYGY